MKSTCQIVQVIVVLLCVLLFQEKSAQAEDLDFGPDQCDRILTHSENVQISRKMVGSTCLLDLHPMNVEDMRYRDYLFTGDGLFMVFNSYGEGPASSTTGARMFYLFPRRFAHPAMAIDSHGNVHVRLVSGHILSMSAGSFRLKSLSDGKIKESVELNSKNKGGVEIQLDKGFFLDTGFTMGQAPNSSETRASSFIDSQAKTCTIKNREVFAYQGDDVDFKFTDDELSGFLKNRCPQITP